MWFTSLTSARERALHLWHYQESSTQWCHSTQTRMVTTRSSYYIGLFMVCTDKHALSQNTFIKSQNRNCRQQHPTTTQNNKHQAQPCECTPHKQSTIRERTPAARESYIYRIRWSIHILNSLLARHVHQSYIYSCERLLWHTIDHWRPTTINAHINHYPHHPSIIINEIHLEFNLVSPLNFGCSNLRGQIPQWKPVTYPYPIHREWYQVRKICKLHLQRFVAQAAIMHLHYTTYEQPHTKLPPCRNITKLLREIFQLFNRHYKSNNISNNLTKHVGHSG